MKISNIYLDQTTAEKVDWHILSSLESALSFYYNYMKSTLNAETFARYKKLLAIFAMSDYVLTENDLRDAFGIEFSETVLNQTPYLRIFIRLHDDNSSVAFGIVHDRIKQLILSDDPKFTKDLVDEIYLKMYSLTSSGMPMDELCGKRFSIFKFSGALLSGDFISQTEKERLAARIVTLPFRQDWSKPVAVAERERLLLKSLADYANSPDSAVAEQYPEKFALAYAVYAHDCFILNFFFESTGHFETCKKYYDLIDMDRASCEVKNEYALMLTIYATHLLLCGKVSDARELIEECTDLCDELFARHEIPLRDYVHYYVAKSNVYHDSGDIANQKKILDKAMKIGGNEYKAVDPARYAFMHTGYASYYESVNKPKKAFKHIEIALENYKTHYDRDHNSMFVGDMVACIGTYIVMLPGMYKDKNKCLELMRRETEILKTVVEKTEFENPNIDMRVHMKVAKFYFLLGLKKECISACTKLLDRIECLLAGKNRDFATVRMFKKETADILAKAKLI